MKRKRKPEFNVSNQREELKIENSEEEEKNKIIKMRFRRDHNHN